MVVSGEVESTHRKESVMSATGEINLLWVESENRRWEASEIIDKENFVGDLELRFSRGLNPKI